MNYQRLFEMAEERVAANGAANYLLSCKEMKETLEAKGYEVEQGPNINKQSSIVVFADEEEWVVLFSEHFGAEVIQKSGSIL
jgi:hypothetical protein